MSDEIIGWSVLGGGLIVLGLLSYFLRRNRMPLVFVTDYQRALRFKNGKFIRIEGPGAYRIHATSESLELVDMRPQPVVLEQVPFEDKSGAKGVISLGTSVSVTDPYLATVKLRDQIGDAVTYLRQSFRKITSERDYRDMFRDPMALSNILSADVKGVLDSVGMGIAQIEITEVWIDPRTTGRSN